jgi:hypothetical protein
VDSKVRPGVGLIVMTIMVIVATVAVETAVVTAVVAKIAVVVREGGMRMMMKTEVVQS